MLTASQHRAELAELARLAGVDLAAVIGGVSDPDVLRAILLDAAPSVVNLYGSAAAAAAAEWYDDLRSDAGASGRFRAMPADLPDEGRYVSLAEWATVPLRQEAPDAAAALERAVVGVGRSVKDASRETIMASSIADPAAQGWRRLASAKACGFCRMLADRGAVYSSSSVSFGAHDHCSCVATPAFGGGAEMVRPFAPSTRNISDADRARTRAWMASNGY